MDSKKSSVFEKHYHDYVNRLAGIDIAPRLPILDIRMDGNTCVIPFCGEDYRVSREGITDTSGNLPAYDVCVMLCRYLLNCPSHLPVQDDWVSFRDFKDAGPLTVFYRNSVEGLIVRSFAGNITALKTAAEAHGGHPPLLALNYDVVMRFVALPRIPLLLLFNDADDDFPPQCSLLFEQRAEKFLDAESIAIVGSILANRLVKDSDAA
ncbi:hypothetical protein D3OALGA1CA_5115 [Olavius algarvensis associated proteobacterium Delta 3]|nr:hypothetical protein D3OALGB2SA_3766 [Olavius algarvensis associated proteobacterium Delta 3]CAB5162039.1 hypothetical protein D3OALGA1CA_5115 [Olavius algarvensis associated proteobacterium Delta 3]